MASPVSTFRMRSTGMSEMRMTRRPSIRSSALYTKSSTAIFGRNPLHIRYLPTYRLEPKNKFKREICERIMKKVLMTALSDFVYTPRKAQILSRHISEEIQSRLRLQNFSRYKIVCLVTIGEKFFQGFHSSVRFLWDATMDEFVNEVYETTKFFCVATVYSIYYD